MKRMNFRLLRNTVFFSLNLILVAAPLRAVSWFPLGPYGGDARSFAADPSDPRHLYLGTATGWIYDSHDGGASWNRIAQIDERNDLVIDHILVDPLHPKHILVGAYFVDRPDGGLYLSDDAGRTWYAQAEMHGQSVRSLARSASNPNELVAGTLTGVFRSLDDGIHWKPISPANSAEIHEIESIAIDPTDPNVIYAPWSSRSTTHTWERFQAEGNSGAIAPDVDDVPRRFPAYLTSLIAAQQGLSVGASSQSGSTSPKIQGELRYTIGQTETDHQDDRTGQDDGYVGRSFFWAGGNLSSSKNYAQPNNPKWVGTGIGYKEILGASPLFWTDSRARWIEVRSKFGDEYNLLPTLHSNYVVTNVATSYFFALASDLDGKYPLRTGAPAYGAVSVGGQAQARTAGVSDSGVRSAYTFERLDLYVYPLWAFSRLFGTSADGPPNAACFSRVTGSEIDWIKAGCSIVTLHIDRQIVNNGLGALNEFAVNWGFRKGLSLSFTRSVGTPDPISNFGLKMTKTATSQLALKLTPGQ